MKSCYILQKRPPGVEANEVMIGIVMVALIAPMIAIAAPMIGMIACNNAIAPQSNATPPSTRINHTSGSGPITPTPPM